MEEPTISAEIQAKIRVIPQRTTLHIIGVDQQGYAIVKSYKCMDCKLETPYLNVILMHQDNPGLWHRLKRWVMRLPDRPIVKARPVTLGGHR